MKLILSLLTVVIFVSACGIKPSSLTAPSDVEKGAKDGEKSSTGYPHTYPRSASR